MGDQGLPRRENTSRFFGPATPSGGSSGAPQYSGAPHYQQPGPGQQGQQNYYAHQGGSPPDPNYNQPQYYNAPPQGQYPQQHQHQQHQHSHHAHPQGGYHPGMGQPQYGSHPQYNQMPPQHPQQQHQHHHSYGSGTQSEYNGYPSQSSVPIPPRMNSVPSNQISADRLPKRTTILPGQGQPAQNRAAPPRILGGPVGHNGNNNYTASPSTSTYASSVNSSWNGGGGGSIDSTRELHQSPPISPVLPAPSRSGSVQRRIQELLDAGATAFSPPNQNYAEAFDSWEKASELALGDNDMFTYAKAISNMGCALRNLSMFDHALALQKLAWSSALRYVEEKQRCDETSLWLQIVLRTLDLEELSIERMAYIDTEAFSRTVARRAATMKNYLTNGKEAASSPDVASGPPIVVWFMDLCTNLGNAYFSVGNFEEAVDWHSKCLLLAENVLEETHIPRQFQRSVAELSAYSYYSQNPATRLIATSSSPRINLSYLHKSTLLAQARSLTHLGVICQYYGLDDNAFQCHYHASALLSYYGSRSPSFTEVEKEKGKAPAQNASKPWYTMQLDLYEGGMAVNLATALHAKGRVPAALDRLNRAIRLFTANNDVCGKSKALANAASLKIEVGKVIGNLHWLRNMDTQARGAGEVDECKRYWGPPRLTGINLELGEPDESANRSAGSPWVEDGLKSLGEQIVEMKKRQDYFGVMTGLLNQANGYLIYGNPYMALHSLTRMIREDLGSVSPTPRSIPPLLHYQTFYTMVQAFFLLTRLQLGPQHALYPGPFATPENGYPVFDSDHVDELLRQMGMNFISASLPELEILTATCLDAFDTIIQTRDEIQSRPSYAVLYTYVGVMGRSEERANTGSSSSSGSTNQISPADDPGFWSGMDLIKQKKALASAMGGKADWVLASKYNLTSPDGKAYYREGTGKLDRAARETLRSIASSGAAQSGRMGSESTSPNNLGADTQGLISTFFDLTSVAFACPPAEPLLPVQGASSSQSSSSSSSAPPDDLPPPPRYPTHGPALYSSPLVPPLRASAIAAASLFSLAGDTMAFAAYQLQRFASGLEQSSVSSSVVARRYAERLDLLQTLRVPSRVEPARVHRELLAAATSMHNAIIGWCDVCFKAGLMDPDRETLVVFWGKAGVMPRSVGGGEGNIADGAHKFPCEHYTWLL
ncbi:hypothetical protein HDU97_000652 [Phlyctochytrium planicorne]|nr:hypothetical protein HDU97_000652 [Phlyctochytrium planicorne]